MYEFVSDGPVTTTVNNGQFSPDVTFNGFAFDVHKGIFLNVPERSNQGFRKPRNENLAQEDRRSV